MTPRERLLAALSGNSTDPVPIWLLFPYHPTSYYVDVRNHPAFLRNLATFVGEAWSYGPWTLSTHTATP